MGDSIPTEAIPQLEEGLNGRQFPCAQYDALATQSRRLCNYRSAACAYGRCVIARDSAGILRNQATRTAKHGK